MVPVVKRLLTSNCLMFITIFRLPFLVAIFIYNEQIGSLLLFQSDLEVACVYSVYMFLGGTVFSRAFSLASDGFEYATDRAVAATVMSVCYYFGVVLSSMIMLSD
jgi:hypothetical protein